MNNKIRWGILGTGMVAERFAIGLQNIDDAQLLAVASRSQKSAEFFAKQFSVTKQFVGYQHLVQDPEIDVVYIATPHSCHLENTLLCLAHGKPVLCEKPFAINASETQQMIAMARKNQLFLMEAMWTRYLPVMGKIRELLAENTIGHIVQFSADFGFYNEFNPRHRLFAPEYGGGALLDIGVYPLAMSFMLLGPPAQIKSMAYTGKSGVDENDAIIMSYTNSPALSILTTSLQANTPCSAVICGTKGRLLLHPPWWKSGKFRLEIFGQESTEFDMPMSGNGYHYQAQEVARCLRAELKESDIMPLDETLLIMQTMDNIRAQWGLNYPMENNEYEIRSNPGH